MRRICPIVLFVLSASAAAFAEDTTIRIDARQKGRLVSRYLTGACIEGVNHEVYGGIYSQIIFGESFQEPVRGDQAVKGFVAVDGSWEVK